MAGEVWWWRGLIGTVGVVGTGAGALVGVALPRRYGRREVRVASLLW